MSAPGLIHLMQEQAAFGFSGKINILKRGSGQFLGSLWQKGDVITQAFYKNAYGLKMALALGVDEIVHKAEFQFVAEPEIIGEKHLAFELKIGEFKNQLSSYIEQINKSETQRPSSELVLKLRNKIFEIDSPHNLNFEEFLLIKSLIQFQRVGDLYKECPLLDHEITLGLVSLRKQGLIEVVAA